MNKCIKVFFTVLLFAGVIFSTSAGPTYYILGKLKYVITAPNGDEYYRCKNRARICVEIEPVPDHPNGMSIITLNTDTGAVTKEITDYELSHAYTDDDGNVIVDLRITPVK